MKNKIVIATHHKTGTNWMGKTFQAISRAFDLPLLKFANRAQAAPGAPCVVLDWHSRWFDDDTLDANARVFHLIRDPRDVIISAMHYHRTSKEAWLHIPRENFSNKTYQQKINELENDRARLIFEMDHTSAKAIRRMASWSYTRPASFEVKYEDLAGAKGAEIFGNGILHLGFSEADLPICLEIFREHSIFHGAAPTIDDHVRSGVTEQWRQVFDAALSSCFIDRFGDVLQKLRYEKDASWADPARRRSVQDKAVD